MVGDWDNVSVVIVDFYHSERPMLAQKFGHTVTHVPPQPSVWQGEHRLTKDNWFAAANTRSTALCLAPDGWILYFDDLSVLMPGYIQAVKDAIAGNYIACGAYRKVKDLIVENGEVKSFTPFPAGEDNRLKHVTQDVTPCAGQWLYGCSLAAPVEALLNVNSWPVDLCDGHGFEDVCMGIVLKNAGYDMRYCRKMMTYESEEDHHKEPAFIRKDFHWDKGVVVEGGNGSTDKSHSALNVALNSKYFPNSFGEGGIRALRQKILAGGEFPIPKTPDREWFTKIPLSDL